MAAAVLLVMVAAAFALMYGFGVVHRLNLRLLHQVETHEFEVDLFVMIVLLTSGLLIDLVVARARARQASELDQERLRVLRATMTTVHDIVNNGLMSLQLVRVESADLLPEDTLAVFDDVILTTSTQLKALADVDQFLERPMAIGTGVVYPRSIS